ncbi:Uncharacterized protein LAWI1_G005808 [Lachnellula willkommii]|uniref:Uncharacterized protein n=1 Tax=Lachnellula willkommii TaxID=215461 RepID=A0A559M8V4_9HELO|nr:Uncharacterized protein LAWI1_G005808 [Lachnellula willkommii]
MIESLTSGSDSDETIGIKSTVLEEEVPVLFNHPVHSYVTPKFYTETKPSTGKVVSTWNYAAVQVYGKATIFHDSNSDALEEFLSKQLDDLARIGEEDIMGYTGTEDTKTPWTKCKKKWLSKQHLAFITNDGYPVIEEMNPNSIPGSRVMENPRGVVAIMRQPNSTPNAVHGPEMLPKEPAPRPFPSSSLATPPFDRYQAQEHPHGGSAPGAPGQTVDSTPEVPHVSDPNFTCSWPGCGKPHMSAYSKKKHEATCFGGSSARLNTSFGRGKHLGIQSGLKDSKKGSAQGVTGNHQASEVSASSMLLYNGPQVSGDHDRVGTTTGVSFEPGISNIDRRVMDGQERSLTDSLKRKHANEAINAGGTASESSKRVRAGPATGIFHPQLTYKMSYRKIDTNKNDKNDCEILAIRTLDSSKRVNTSMVLADSFRSGIQNITEQFNEHADNFNKLDEWHKGQILALEKLNEEDQQTIHDLQQHSANQVAEIERLCKSHKQHTDALRALWKNDEKKFIEDRKDSAVMQAAKIEGIRAGYENKIAELEKSEKQNLETIETLKRASAHHLTEVKKLHQGYKSQISKLEKLREVDNDSIRDMMREVEGGIGREKKLDDDFEKLRKKYEELYAERQSLKEMADKCLLRVKLAKELREKNQEMKNKTQQPVERVSEPMGLEKTQQPVEHVSEPVELEKTQQPVEHVSEPVELEKKTKQPVEHASKPVELKKKAQQAEQQSSTASDIGGSKSTADQSCTDAPAKVPQAEAIEIARLQRMHQRDQDQISALSQGRKGDKAKIAELQEQNTQISALEKENRALEKENRALEKENQELSAELEKLKAANHFRSV